MTGFNAEKLIYSTMPLAIARITTPALNTAVAGLYTQAQGFYAVVGDGDLLTAF